MRTVFVFIAMLFVVFSFSCSSVTTTDFSASDVKQVSQSAFGISWNNHCTVNHFSTNWLVTANTTLGDMYSGSDFYFDIAEMDRLISRDLGEASGLAEATPLASYIFYDDEGDDVD